MVFIVQEWGRGTAGSKLPLVLVSSPCQPSHCCSRYSSLQDVLRKNNSGMVVHFLASNTSCTSSLNPNSCHRPVRLSHHAPPSPTSGHESPLLQRHQPPRDARAAGARLRPDPQARPPSGAGSAHLRGLGRRPAPLPPRRGQGRRALPGQGEFATRRAAPPLEPGGESDPLPVSDGQPRSLPPPPSFLSPATTSPSLLPTPLPQVRDPALKHALGFGVGIITETMTEAERGVVDLLFESGAVQVSTCGLIRSSFALRGASCASPPLMCVSVCVCACPGQWPS